MDVYLIVLTSNPLLDYERGRLEIEKLRWSMSVECVAELRRFYDSQEVIEKEQANEDLLLQKQRRKENEDQKKAAERSSDSIPDETDQVQSEENSMGKSSMYNICLSYLLLPT